MNTEVKNTTRNILDISHDSFNLIESLNMHKLSTHLIKSPSSYRLVGEAHYFHAEQKDKSGADYIVHLLHTADIALNNKRKLGMSHIPDEIIVQAALFHDFEEDKEPAIMREKANLTINKVYDNLEFDKQAIDAIQSVSRKDDETYGEFIKRVIDDGKSNPLAKLIKYADLKSNSHPLRVERLGSMPESLTKRYKKALKNIEESCKVENNLTP